MSDNGTSEFEYVGATLKVTGEAPLAKGIEFDHGDVQYIVAKVAVNEIAFPEDKNGNVLRVHKAKASDVFLVNEEDAEKIVAAERERVTGQGNIIAELNRRESEDLVEVDNVEHEDAEEEDGDVPELELL